VGAACADHLTVFDLTALENYKHHEGFIVKLSPNSFDIVHSILLW
jgi:hypothetical protein